MTGGYACFPARRRGASRIARAVKPERKKKLWRIRTGCEFAIHFKLKKDAAAGRGQAAAPTVETKCGAYVCGNAEISPCAWGEILRLCHASRSHGRAPYRPSATSPGGGSKAVVGKILRLREDMTGRDDPSDVLPPAGEGVVRRVTARRTTDEGDGRNENRRMDNA